MIATRNELAPRYGSRVDGTGNRVSKPIRGVPWQPASAPSPAEQDSIVRAHRLMGYSRSLRRQGAKANGPKPGRTQETVRGVSLSRARCNCTRQPRGSLNVQAGGPTKVGMGIRFIRLDTFFTSRLGSGEVFTRF